jgi:hypothetical protein
MPYSTRLPLARHRVASGLIYDVIIEEQYGGRIQKVVPSTVEGLRMTKRMWGMQSGLERTVAKSM